MSTKRIRGGKIRKNGINDTVPFNFIQSIGYELETTQLAKFTLLSEDEDSKLMHTDLGTNYLDILRGKDVRKKELMELTEPGDGFIFLVTNDKAETNFTRHLQTICESERKKARSDAEDEAVEDEDEADEDEADEDEEDGDAFYLAKDFKNSLYIFMTKEGIEHPIQFEYSELRHCGFFSDVEWVGTFLTPERGPNIILETFVQLLERLFQHLDALEKTDGNLIVHFSDKDEVVVGKPTERKLFNLKGTSLYYLQTNYGEGKMVTLDDLLLKPQMTFSCPVKDLTDILKAMIQPVSRTNFASRVLSHHAEFIQTLGTIVEELCDTEISSGFNMKGEHLATFQGYLWLFLFKIFRYYIYFIKPENDRAEYFKNTLFFNSRHGNAQLYQAMKALLAEHLGGNGNPVEILQKIILQPNILKKIFLGTKILRKIFLITKTRHERPNAKTTDIFEFNKDLTLDDPHYGDPCYSLKSYLQFFEKPKIHTDSSNDPERPIHGAVKLNVNDWFHYSNTDKFSSQMEIKNHLVLVEVRCFQELIVDTFIDELFPLKLFPKRDEEHVRSLTIGQLKKCVKIYRDKPTSLPPSRPRQAWKSKGGKPSRRTRKMQKLSKV